MYCCLQYERGTLNVSVYRFCFCSKRGNCHFVVCSFSSVSILISTSNKYHSFSYSDICHCFGFVRTTSFSLFRLSNLCFHSKACSYICNCLNAVCYNIDFFSMTVINVFPSSFLWKLKLYISK